MFADTPHLTGPNDRIATRENRQRKTMKMCAIGEVEPNPIFEAKELGIDPRREYHIKLFIVNIS